MSNVSLTPSIATVSNDSVKVNVQKPVINESKKVSIPSDSLKTSGIRKDPVWEGVKLGAKDGLKNGLLGGAIGGAAVTAIGIGAMTWIGSGKFSPLALGVKPLVYGTLGGTLVGGTIGVVSGVAEKGLTGVVVKGAVKQSDNSNTEETVSKAGKRLGLGLGAAAGAYNGYQLSKSFSNPYAKAASITIATGLGALAGAKASETVANKIYQQSK